jgi:hypothetical protein
MSQTLCIKCGSELKVSSHCQLCQQPLVFACPSCDYITEEKVHAECRNAEVLAKTIGANEEATPANTIAASMPTAMNREETIADKPKEEEETVKAEPSFPSSSSYMTTEQDTKNNNNVYPFITGTEFWQNIMTYWLNAYGQFFKNAPKMTEYWYDTYWKPWLNWMPRPQQQDKDRVKVE